MQHLVSHLDQMTAAPVGLLTPTHSGLRRKAVRESASEACQERCQQFPSGGGC